MSEVYQTTDDIYVLPAHEFAPGFGYLPINVFLIKCDEPVLVDTGFCPSRDAMLQGLRSLIDPAELKWIFLTHEDQDHAGNLQAMMETAPNARLATNFMGYAKLGGEWAIPMNRVFLVNNGQNFLAGDRQFRVVRPPAFDSGATAGLFDERTRTFFSADAFGALLPQPTASLDAVEEADFMAGFNFFNNANHPWLCLVDPAKFDRELEAMRQLQPKTVLSSHLPPAHGRSEQLLDWLKGIPLLPTFVGPDQAALEAMLAKLKAA